MPAQSPLPVRPNRTPSPRTHASSSTPSLPPAIVPGAILDGFRIDRPLGHGGSSVVFAAWDLTKNRPAAVKILGTAIQSSRLYSRFRREATTVAGLKHPGIVELYQLGQTATLCYLAMERVEGITLRNWIEQVPRMTVADLVERSGVVSHEPTESGAIQTVRFDNLPLQCVEPEEPSDSLATSHQPAILSDSRYIRHVVHMLHDLVAALVHAHRKGVTHRDLKPENVMVEPNGRVVIIDFGLARSFSDTTLTSQSALIGTPMYMSPEQLKGCEADAVSDLYAVGLIGYELLSRSVPFRATSVEGLLGEVLHKPAPPLVGRNPAVLPELANIVHRAMAKDPADRYASAEELRADLDRYLSGERVTATNYRYEFNANEVIAVRPRRVAVAGYLNVAISAFMGIALMLTLDTPRLSTLLTFGETLLYLLAGWRVGGGRSFARLFGWASVVASLGVVAFAVTLFVANVPPVTWPLATLFGGVFLAIAGQTAYALGSRRGRAWFRHMREKRQEFEDERNPAQPVRGETAIDDRHPAVE